MRTTTSATGAQPTSSAQDTTSDPGVLAVYGDGNSEGGTGAAGWPALVAQQLGMQLQLSAAIPAGYVRPGSTGQTYSQLVRAQPPSAASVTVVSGSRNDVSATPAGVQAAARRTFSEILAATPPRPW